MGWRPVRHRHILGITSVELMVKQCAYNQENQLKSALDHNKDQEKNQDSEKNEAICSSSSHSIRTSVNAGNRQ
jgi:hypothetical protein